MAIIKADPHAGQWEVHESSARFKVLDCGRRWGKTRLGVMECLTVAAQGGRAWWVAPSYKMSEVGWRPLRRMASQIPNAEIRKADRLVEFQNGGSVTIRSADNPDSLRGEGLDFCVMDECAFIHENAWSEVLRPALADRKGSALFISTPKGRNWFWRLWMRGQDESATDWSSWRFTSYENPYIANTEIDTAKESLPERIFRQEFLAEFIDDAGGVFRNVMACANAGEKEPNTDGEYLFGVDFGKHNDFTVIVVMDLRTKAMVKIDRFNQIDYTVQVGRLQALAEQYRPTTIIAERNSMGDPLVEDLQRRGLPVQPFTTTNASKAQIIDELALAFERREISILNDVVLVGELQAYEMERLPSGSFRYNAPSGMHDDTVMALALAWSGMANSWLVF